MPSDTTWYLSLDRQRLQKAYAANGPLELVDCDVGFLQSAPAGVDVVTGVTEQSVCVYFALSHTWGHLDEPRHSSIITSTQPAHRREFSSHLTRTQSSPVRCHASELRECITWLVFQTLEDIASTPLSQQFDTALRPPGEDCQREIEHALRAYRTSLVRYLLKALYFAAVAVRLLDPEELFDVVQDALANTGEELAAVQQFQAAHDEDAPRSSTELLRLVSRLLLVNKAGKVQFRSASMRDFLLLSKYLAHENGDEHMARSCLQYVFEDNESHVLKPWRGFCDRARLARRRPFFRYASSHWHRHYRSAENTSNDLAAQLHQRIEREVISLWGHRGFLHIELQGLCLQMGLAVCTYYDFQFLMSIYLQMGASECGATSVLVSFPRPLEYNLLFVGPRMIGSAAVETEVGYRACDRVCEAAPVPLVAEPSWADSLTDGESSLEESWASLPSRPQSEQWISDFDDLRLGGFNENVFVHQDNRKGSEDGWEVIDRKPGFRS